MRTLLLLLPVMAAACSTHIGRPATPAPAPQHTSYTVVTDVLYTPPAWPAPLLADVYRPDGPGPFPGVLLIHGGAWKRGDRAQVEGLAERIAARGYVVVNVAYRLVPDYVWPAQLEDIQQAIRWMRSPAGLAHGVDPQRIGSFGYSAGGHLAALAGAIADDRQWGDPQAALRAVVAGGNPADLPAFRDGALVPAFIGGSWAEREQSFRDASPLHHVSAGDPPVFLYHASLDGLVPIDQAQRYKAALDRAGIVSEYFVIRGHGHVSGFFFDGAAVSAALAFLDRHLR